MIAMHTIGKKTYEQPEMSVVQLSAMSCALLAGSVHVTRFADDDEHDEDFEWGSGGGL